MYNVMVLYHPRNYATLHDKNRVRIVELLLSQHPDWKVDEAGSGAAAVKLRRFPPGNCQKQGFVIKGFVIKSAKTLTEFIS